MRKVQSAFDAKPKPAASKTRKKTRAAIRATMDSPLVIVLSAACASLATHLR